MTTQRQLTKIETILAIIATISTLICGIVSIGYCKILLPDVDKRIEIKYSDMRTANEKLTEAINSLRVEIAELRVEIRIMNGGRK